MTPASIPPTVLIAAHEPSQRLALAQMLRAVRPGIAIVEFGASEAPEAAKPSVAMVVEGEGEQLGEISARLRARHPELPLVVIAARFDEAAIAAAARVQARAIAPSPCEPATLLRLLEGLERGASFAGRVAGIASAELLRLHASARSTGVLHLKGEAGEGAIYLEDGQPIHAHAGELRGAEAVHHLLAWSDAQATWLIGRSASARTIVGRVEGLLSPRTSDDGGALEVPDTPRDVLEKLDRLAQTQDILAAYLLRNGEIVSGRCEPELDPAAVGTALSRLSQVFSEMEEQQGDNAGSEIQATVGEHRLVIDRLGPARLAFQIGVVVRQATPVCKSLRRLLRQIDRSFRKSLSKAAQAEAGSSGLAGPVTAAGLHRVA